MSQYILDLTVQSIIWTIFIIVEMNISLDCILRTQDRSHVANVVDFTADESFVHY